MFPTLVLVIVVVVAAPLFSNPFGTCAGIAERAKHTDGAYTTVSIAGNTTYVTTNTSCGNASNTNTYHQNSKDVKVGELLTGRLMLGMLAATNTPCIM